MHPASCSLLAGHFKVRKVEHGLTEVEGARCSSWGGLGVKRFNPNIPCAVKPGSAVTAKANNPVNRNVTRTLRDGMTPNSSLPFMQGLIPRGLPDPTPAGDVPVAVPAVADLG